MLNFPVKSLLLNKVCKNYLAQTQSIKVLRVTDFDTAMLFKLSIPIFNYPPKPILDVLTKPLMRRYLIGHLSIGIPESP